jgi:hypothetical protein
MDIVLKSAARRLPIVFSQGLIVAALAACGGGDDSAGAGSSAGGNAANTGSSSTAAIGVNTDPKVVPVTVTTKGDVHVYTTVTTNTNAAGTVQPSTSQQQVRYTSEAASDGTYTRVDTSSATNVATRTNQQTSEGRTKTTISALGNAAEIVCSYSPAYRQGPAFKSAIDVVTANFSTETCAGTTFNGSFTHDSTHTPKGSETITLPLGTFEAFKYVSKETIKSSSDIQEYTNTTWLNPTDSRFIRFESSVTFRTLTNVITSTRKTVTTLVAVSANGVAATGPIVNRFVGSWTRAVTSAGQTIPCSLIVSAAGQITGTCQDSDGTFPITGAVDASGAVKVGDEDGTATGSFDSPVSGSGTFLGTDGSKGTWVAKHI